MQIPSQPATTPAPTHVTHVNHPPDPPARPPACPPARPPARPTRPPPPAHRPTDHATHSSHTHSRENGSIQDENWRCVMLIILSAGRTERWQDGRYSNEEMRERKQNDREREREKKKKRRDAETHNIASSPAGPSLSVRVARVPPVNYG